MAKRYILQHHPEMELPSDLSNEFCDIWLSKLYAYASPFEQPIRYCCGLDTILRTHPFMYGALRFWMLHHVSQVKKIWQHDIIIADQIRCTNCRE